MIDPVQPKRADRNFNHPYQPYDIQTEFMLTLYDCIEQGKVGIFESPTGTGKTLSLLCGSLTWLRDHKRAAFEADISAADTGDEPEWIVEHARKERKQQILESRRDFEAKLEAVREKERRIRERFENREPLHKRRKVTGSTSNNSNDDEEQYVLDDYSSEDDASASKQAKHGDDLGLSTETRTLMQKLGLLANNAAEHPENESEAELKIFVCSRTHSQLTQMVGELQRIKVPSAFPSKGVEEREAEYPVEQVKQLSLGSRKNLCINEKVVRLSNPTAINERCLELQDKKTPADQRCQYLPNKENEAISLDFQNHALSKIRDIEDLASLGRKLGVCPYYAARPAVKPSEIVTLPYPLLLQPSARQALDIDLKDQVVIIDEAHNLMDAVLGIYTIEISLAQLSRCREQMTIYLQKFRNRLKGKNRVYVTQVVRLLDSLITFANKAQSQKQRDAAGTVHPGELLSGKGVDQIDLYRLMHYLQESKLARKVQGYGSHLKEQSLRLKEAESGRSKVEAVIDTVPVLQHLQSFILALTNPAAEGRFFYASGKTDSETRIKYLLLDPSEHFRDIVESARSVVLAGGTMSPMDDYLQQLFPYLPPSKITTLSCGHVIPASNLFVSTLAASHTGTDFDFTFAARQNEGIIRTLGETLVRLLKLIPDGAVIFFPSYSYLDIIVSAWKQASSTSLSIWSQLESEKPIFVDSQNADTDHILDSYTTAINQATTKGSNKGALLLSVIGGKLSEGINFSDRLGRCVIVIGLPYPNPHSPEWKAKMEYIETKAAARGLPRGTASRDFAESVCMRAVNQAIGRAVRHKGDWAGILLVDRRYAQRRIQEKLPKWIQGSLFADSGRGFGAIEAGMGDFYRRKEADGKI